MAMTATRFCASDINTSHTAQVSIWPGVGENYGESTLPERIENGNKLLQADTVNLPVPPDLRRGLALALHLLLEPLRGAFGGEGFLLALAVCCGPAGVPLSVF